MASETKRVALITGGSRGIGLGIAAALADSGFALALNGVRPAADTAGVLEGLRKRKATAEYFPGDVSNATDRESLVDAVRNRFGRLDVLVNNAGVAPSPRADILDASEESFERVLGINLKGPYFLTQLVARWMIEQRASNPQFQGVIVNISSVSATEASINRGDYCISKAGVAMATQLWAHRLAEHGIAVYEVRPGIIHTDMSAAVAEKYDKLIAEGLTVENRWGEPADVGRAVAMLARGDLTYATGNVLSIDGGMTLRRL
ncbi:MAG TPA: 3-ketoacyl-ACP reductase [Lacipirellulaceae bacterium]|jgi:NAD(P)-dependent dehydrogenase (short-subunit alcohol dehydrogenase family)|nr:3-ketoacyl-ACP reductase [Lacipirellulaceae bacterium]